jgi:hypothetical protein
VENLSPFLFAVFINDLETFLDIHEAPSLQTIRKYKSINDFKIKMLSNVECIFLKPACEGEIRLTSSANPFPFSSFYK